MHRTYTGREFVVHLAGLMAKGKSPRFRSDDASVPWFPYIDHAMKNMPAIEALVGARCIVEIQPDHELRLHRYPEA
jgi:hypothetical protein